MPESPNSRVERRKQPHGRRGLQLRYMFKDQREHQGNLSDASAVGLALVGPQGGKLGERVIVYVAKIGRFEGEIVQHFDGGFAIRFDRQSKASDTVAELASDSAARTEPGARSADSEGREGGHVSNVRNVIARSPGNR